MTLHHHESVVCECGHGGYVHWRENDAPYSRQWEAYDIQGFEGASFSIDGFLSLDEAPVRIDPKCPACGARGKVSYAKEP